METYVFLAMLAAAACHAGWNSILKLKLTPFAALVLINTASAIVVSPLVLLVPFPDRAAWPYLFGSLVLHMLYYIGLTEAYRAGDLGQVYPIARGGAPLLTAVAAYLWLGEDPGGLGWSGIAVLAVGILTLSFAGRKSTGGLESRATVLALLTAVSISLYTVVDGIGARSSTSTASYIAWLFFLDGLDDAGGWPRMPRPCSAVAAVPRLLAITDPGRRNGAVELWDGNLGHDRRANRLGCRSSGNERAVCRRPWHRRAEGTGCSGANPGGFRRTHRPGYDAAELGWVSKGLALWPGC